MSQLARQHVTVSLSGDAGDELFGGYNRYLWCSRIWQQIGWMPLSLRRVLANTLTSLSCQTWDKGFAKFDSLLPSSLKQRNSGEKLHKLAEILDVNSRESMYRLLCSHWKDPEALVLGATEPATVLSNPQQWGDLPNFNEQMMYLDTVSYLPGDILTKVDRASMEFATFFENPRQQN